MFAVFQIKDSPAIPFEKVIKVDPIFNGAKDDDKPNDGKKWGFSVHLGEQNKRCNFYLATEQEAISTRELFIQQWNEYYAKKYELVD